MENWKGKNSIKDKAEPNIRSSLRLVHRKHRDMPNQFPTQRCGFWAWCPQKGHFMVILMLLRSPFLSSNWVTKIIKASVESPGFPVSNPISSRPDQWETDRSWPECLPTPWKQPYHTALPSCHWQPFQDNSPSPERPKEFPRNFGDKFPPGYPQKPNS